MMKKSILILLLACAAASAQGADVSVPYLGLLTNGRLNAAGTFELSTRASIDMLVAGGAKFDAWFKLGFRNAAMEHYLKSVESIGTLSDPAGILANLEAASGLSLRTVAIQVKELFGLPLQMATFVGHLDTFCSGGDFTTEFGSSDFSTKFRGYMYYPEGVGGDPSRHYDGLHEVYGTGVRLSWPLATLRPFLYLYQDSWLGAGYWSADARVLLDADRIKLEAYAGASFPLSALGVYRAGLLFHFNTGEMGNFYAQIGIPRWDPTEPFGMNMLSFMFEPRIHFGEGELVLSLFFHPAWYMQKLTHESGAVELRFDLGYGRIEEGRFRAGVESELAYYPDKDLETLTVDAAPYFQTVSKGVRWDIRLAVRAFPFPRPWYAMFMPTLGLSTAF